MSPRRDEISADEIVVLLVDLQEPILARSRTNPSDKIRRVAGALDRAAEVLGIPVILSAVPTGSETPSVISELQGTVLVRQGTGALDDAPTLAAIHATGRKHLAIGGVITEVAAISAVRGALRRGFEVTLLVDLCGGTSERSERAVFDTLTAQGVEILPLASFLAPFVTDFGSEPGKTLLPTLRETYA